MAISAVVALSLAQRQTDRKTKANRTIQLMPKCTKKRAKAPLNSLEAGQSETATNPDHKRTKVTCLSPGKGQHIADLAEDLQGMMLLPCSSWLLSQCIRLGQLGQCLALFLLPFLSLLHLAHNDPFIYLCRIIVRIRLKKKYLKGFLLKPQLSIRYTEWLLYNRWQLKSMIGI